MQYLLAIDSILRKEDLIELKKVDFINISFDEVKTRE